MGRRPVRLAVGVFALAALAYTASGFLPGRVLLPLDQLREIGAWKPDPTERHPVSNRLLSDAVLQFHPWDVAARRAISAGEFPWSNPWAARGAPLLANPQSALLSPFTWPRLVVGMRGWAISVFLKLFLTGFGVFWLAREMGGDAKSAVLSGLFGAGSGYAIVWGLHPHTNVFAFLPFLAAAALRLMRRVSPQNMLAVIAFSALATAGGHPETLAVGVIGIGFFLLGEAVVGALREQRRARLRACGWVAAASASGFLLLGMQLLPFSRVLLDSRTVELRASSGTSSFRVLAFFGQILPGFLGSPLSRELDLSGAVASGENFNTRSQGFVGLVTLVLFLLSIRSLAPCFRRSLIIAAVALAIAWQVPPLDAILSHLPVLSLGARQYWAAVFVLFACAGAGPSLFVLVRAGRPARRTGTVLLIAGALLVLAGLLPMLPSARTPIVSAGRSGIQRLRAKGFLRLPPEIYEVRMARYLETGQATALRRLAIPGACWLLAGWSLLFPRRRGWILLFAALGELAGFGFGYLPAVSRRQTPGEAAVVRDLKRLDPDRRWLLAAGEDVYPPNLATLDQIRDIRSYDLLEESRWVSRLRSFGYDEATRSFRVGRPPEAAAGLAAEGVRYFLSRELLAGAPRVGGGAPPAVGLYELPGARPKLIPRNNPPEGFRQGVLVSVSALVACAFLLFLTRRRLEPPRSSPGG